MCGGKNSYWLRCVLLYQVGDMVSLIMMPSDETSWWRGKKVFEVCSAAFSAYPCATSTVLSLQSVCVIELLELCVVLR
jgi:hypothetical protein